MKFILNVSLLLFVSVAMAQQGNDSEKICDCNLVATGFIADFKSLEKEYNQALEFLQKYCPQDKKQIAVKIEKTELLNEYQVRFPNLKDIFNIRFYKAKKDLGFKLLDRNLHNFPLDVNTKEDDSFFLKKPYAILIPTTKSK